MQSSKYYAIIISYYNLFMSMDGVLDRLMISIIDLYIFFSFYSIFIFNLATFILIFIDRVIYYMLGADDIAFF